MTSGANSDVYIFSMSKALPSLAIDSSARITNPGRRDMTGQTTMAYANQEFAEMVTRHLRKAIDTGQPACFDIEAKLYG